MLEDKENLQFNPTSEEETSSRKYTVLSDTAERNNLVGEQSKRVKKSIGAARHKGERKVTGKGKGNREVEKVKRKKLQEEKSEGNDAEYYCIVCHEAFSESRAGED
jgi:hypothetical protein